MSKVNVRLNEILADKDKTIYWLAKQTGITNNTLGRLAKNQTDRITFELIAKICDTLKIEISDLLELSSEE